MINNSKTNTARFICTTFELRNYLYRIENLGSLRELQIDVVNDKTIREIIFVNTGIKMRWQEIQGSGSFTYRIDSITKLIACLESLNEQPITVRLDNHITIEELTF